MTPEAHHGPAASLASEHHSHLLKPIAGALELRMQHNVSVQLFVVIRIQPAQLLNLCIGIVRSLWHCCWGVICDEVGDASLRPLRDVSITLNGRIVGDANQVLVCIPEALISRCCSRKRLVDITLDRILRH